MMITKEIVSMIKNRYVQFYSLVTENEKLLNERINELAINIADIDIRRKICSIDVNKDCRKKLKHLLNFILLKYNFHDLDFNDIYDTTKIGDPKSRKRTARYNGSDPRTVERLKYALKYQLIANDDCLYPIKDCWFPDKQNKLKYYHIISFMIVYKLLYNVNNSITYNVDNDLNKAYYNPITNDVIKNIVRDVINELEYCNYELIGIDGNPTKIKIKPNREQKNMKRFDCTQLTNYIELATIKNNKPPTLNELKEFINEMLEETSYGNDVEPICHEQYLRYYINIYNLGDKISQRKRRTKAEKESQENKK